MTSPATLPSSSDFPGLLTALPEAEASRGHHRSQQAFPRSSRSLLSLRGPRRREPETPCTCALCWHLTASLVRVRKLPRPLPGLRGRGAVGADPSELPASLGGLGGASRESGKESRDPRDHAPCPGLLLKPLDSSPLANRSPPCLERRPMSGALGPLPAPRPARPFPKSLRDGRGAGAGVGCGDAPKAGSQWEANWALMDGNSGQWRGTGRTSRRGESVIWRRPTITCSSCC